MTVMKNLVLLFVAIALLSSCKKDIPYSEIAGNWIETDQGTGITLDFTTSTTNYGSGTFRYSLSDHTLNYNVRAEPTWKITILSSTTLTLTSSDDSSIVQHFSKVP
jgi:hypothetical protein